MSSKRFKVQPTWVDFIIFWALIVCGVSIAVVIQMEVNGYAGVNAFAAVLLIIVLLAAGCQVWRTTLTVTAKTVTFGHVLPSNRIAMPWADVTHVTQQGHQLIFATRQYGTLTVVRLGGVAGLVAAIDQHVTVHQAKEEANV